MTAEAPEAPDLIVHEFARVCRLGEQGKRGTGKEQDLPLGMRDLDGWAWTELLLELAELDPPRIPTSSRIAWRITPHADTPHTLHIEATVEARRYAAHRKPCRMCQSIAFLMAAGTTREYLPRVMHTTPESVARHLAHRGQP